MEEMEERIEEKKENGKVSFPDWVKERLFHMHYGIVGHHSAVEICSWTKKAIRRKGACYKHKFYGIETHRCAQMSPAAMWCQNNCIFCWRPMEFMKKIKMEREEVDEPEEIIEGVVKERKRLLSGLGGAEDRDEKLFREAYELFPSHWAISLSGEPTIYPKLPELIKKLKENPEVKSIFVVSNGQEPEMIERMWREGALPHQLYISVTAPNERLYKEISKPLYEDAWQRLTKSLSLLSKLPCRTVIRFTVIKGLNDGEELLEEYAKLFEWAYPDFIEIKAYMHLGFSAKRLKKENMPSHEEIRKLAKKLLEKMKKFQYMDEQEESRIVVLQRKEARFDRWLVKREEND